MLYTYTDSSVCKCCMHILTLKETDGTMFANVVYITDSVAKVKLAYTGWLRNKCATSGECDLRICRIQYEEVGLNRNTNYLSQPHAENLHQTRNSLELGE